MNIANSDTSDTLSPKENRKVNTRPIRTSYLFLLFLQEVEALHGHTEGVKDALTNGAKVDGTSRGLRTPLHNAARNGHLDMVKILCDYQANLRLRSLLDKGKCIQGDLLYII